MSASRIPISNYILDAAGGTTFTTAWKTVTTNHPADTYEVEFFNSTGEVMELGVGSSTAAVTALSYYIMPGGVSGRVGVKLDAGMKIYHRMTSSTVATGVILLNFLR